MTELGRLRDPNKEVLGERSVNETCIVRSGVSVHGQYAALQGQCCAKPAAQWSADQMLGQSCDHKNSTSCLRVVHIDLTLCLGTDIPESRTWHCSKQLQPYA